MQNWPCAAEIIDALQLIQADFDGRPTHQVTGKGGKLFEFFPTSITDNIPPLHPKVSRAICLISQLHLEHAAKATKPARPIPASCHNSDANGPPSASPSLIRDWRATILCVQA